MQPPLHARTVRRNMASAPAYRLNAGVVPVRKRGKLPFQPLEESYQLEYGSNTLAVHVDAIQPGQRVLLVDDVLATGGTVGATAALISRLGAELVHGTVPVVVGFLPGREKLTELGIENYSAGVTV